jgi:hypothetical protein
MVSPWSFPIRHLTKRSNGDGAAIASGFRHPANSLAVGRPRRPWETRTAGRYASARVGGIARGVVTLTATTTPRVVVAASWGDRSISVTRMSEREALAVANAWIDQLAAGREPAP